jgi:hypothetical protein
MAEQPNRSIAAGMRGRLDGIDGGAAESIHCCRYEADLTASMAEQPNRSIAAGIRGRLDGIDGGAAESIHCCRYEADLTASMAEQPNRSIAAGIRGRLDGIDGGAAESIHCCRYEADLTAQSRNLISLLERSEIESRYRLAIENPRAGLRSSIAGRIEILEI